MDERKPAKVAGRPRDPAVEERILDATLALLAQQGYARMSLDDVAAAAGVGKPALYRRWKGKADLATAALERLRIAEPAAPFRSTVYKLRGVLENFRRSLLRPNGMALMGTVLAEEAHTPELLRLFRERLVHPRRRMLRGILDQAMSDGELRADTPIEAAVAMLVGSIYAQYLAESSVSPAFVRRVVDTVWRGIVLPEATVRK